MTDFDKNQFAYDLNAEFPDQSQNFNFQSYDQSSYAYPATSNYSQYSNLNSPHIFTPTEFDTGLSREENEFDELPLLEELEIYPARIMEKSLAVLNPFHAKGLADDGDYLFKETDLAGPIAFCLALAVCLFMSGSKVQFGYIYGLSVISVIVMWMLIKLMMCNDTPYVTISNVASILGYSILPIVWLSILGIFLTLNNRVGIILAGMSVFLSSAASSRIFCLMTGDKNQRYLIAYPCSLVYIIFVLLVLF